MEKGSEFIFGINKELVEWAYRMGGKQSGARLTIYYYYGRRGDVVGEKSCKGNHAKNLLEALRVLTVCDIPQR